MAIFVILIHGLLSTLLAERAIHCKKMNFTRQHLVRAITDAEYITELVREYFTHFRYHPSHFVHKVQHVEYNS